jgi:hypothetical protein
MLFYILNPFRFLCLLCLTFDSISSKKVIATVLRNYYNYVQN